MKKTLSFVVCFIVTISAFAQSPEAESRKIALFCKVWGFLKYHHPAVASGKIDWDKKFTEGLPALKSLNTKEAVNQFYETLLDSLGSVGPVKKGKRKIVAAFSKNFDNNWLNDASNFTGSVIERLNFIYKNRNQDSNYYVQTYPVGNTGYTNEKPYPDSVYPSPEMRLLTLSRYWNIVNYFFPYKYLIGRNWDSVLVEMIPKFRYAKDTVAYHVAIAELVASINDSHAGIDTRYFDQYLGLYWAPFRFKIVDRKAIVTGYYSDSLCSVNDVRKGDLILSVNGQTIDSVLKEKWRYVAASNESAKLNFFYAYVFNGATDSVSIRYDRNGIVTEKKIGRYYSTALKNNDKKAAKDTFKIMEGNIGYVHMGALQPEQTDRAMQALKHTKAIIFDVRNYPNNTMYKISAFLNSRRQPFVKVTRLDITHPGWYYMSKPIYTGKNNKEYYKGLVILLFNESTQSHAEFTLMALQTAPNVIGIGSQTSGADGNVSEFVLPGNITTYITGLGIYYPDGRETQRIGIVPDIEVRPTIKGIREGRDELLEKALQVIAEKTK
jgi:carboxyl-terminal processing protease